MVASMPGNKSRQQVDQQCGQSSLKSFWQILLQVHPNCERLKWKQNCATAELRFMPNYVLFGFKFRLELPRDLCWLFATAYGTLKWAIAFSAGADIQVEIEGRRCWLWAGLSKLTGCVSAANRFKPRHFGHLICIIWNHVNDQRMALCSALLCTLQSRICPILVHF